MRAPTPLQDGQTEVCIFAERVARPAACVIERGAADQAHGAVHDDRIRLVALHHADIEESRVFGIHSCMDESAPAVTVILWRLDHAGCGIREARYQALQPVRMDHITGIDDADDLSVLSRMRGRHAQRARLEAVKVLHTNKLEAATEVQAAGSDGL